MEIKGKNVLIIGLARSGVGAANLLFASGAVVTVTDRKPREELDEYVSQLSPGVRLCLGGYPQSTNGTDLIVISPGVPLTIGPLVQAREKGVRIIGEFEIAYQMMKVKSPKSKFMAVTGTNGKSTTTTLLDLMLRKGGFSTILGGNIGNALTEEILKAVGSLPVRQAGQRSTVNSQALARSNRRQGTADGRLVTVDYIVAEVSSFQLESIAEFKPAGAAILNITPDHLDRYHSLSDYVDAKCRIFENQGPDDFLVLNADDPMTGEIARRIGRQGLKEREMPRVYYFSRKHEVKGAYLSRGDIYFDLPGVPPNFVLHPSSFKIKGVHNLENAMASSAMALLAGCPPASVAEALNDFPGLEHRLEFVRELDGVRYINDSKGTNVGAVMKSLEGFSEPIVLIAGGRDKKGDFESLRPLVKDKVKALVLIGEASTKMRDALGDLTDTVFAAGLQDAVEAAKGSAKSGDIVLLSPACASFDMFRDFEDRGRQFKKIVEGLS